MANRVEQSLTDELIPLLQKERYVLLSTIDHQSGAPNSNAISWAFAADKDHVRFAVDNRSRIVENIRKNGSVTLTLIGNETTYAISGDASVKHEKMEDVPLKLAMLEIAVSEVRDVMFYGSKISVEPQYEKTYDEQAAAKLDRQVMEALKNG
ncbi:pyridoxamine 5'-phosphate oxidase family protein [Bacillus marinisedimentorum]|uniref:pyridoxamine 5'-phosphate oxidase family protein n=1 Tax=Bacillus marinisedimentorum TaxID=1821260 RepID=UPI0007E140CC|nr:pyridoxamine 5'-phosphate oxidase family protein [Bacillus marinisedimentorum]